MSKRKSDIAFEKSLLKRAKFASVSEIDTRQLSVVNVARQLFGDRHNNEPVERKKAIEYEKKLIISKTKVFGESRGSVPITQIHCNDAITALYMFWEPLQIYRFFTAVRALLFMPNPIPPPPLSESDINNDQIREVWMMSCNQWLAESAARSEEGVFARSFQIPVENDGIQYTISIRAFVHALCNDFSDSFRLGIFEDLDELIDESKQTERTHRLSDLTKQARGVTVLLLAHDVRIQRLVFRDCHRFFADVSVPDHQRVKHFIHTCRMLAQRFVDQGYTLEDIAKIAWESWLHGTMDI